MFLSDPGHWNKYSKIHVRDRYQVFHNNSLYSQAPGKIDDSNHINLAHQTKKYTETPATQVHTSPILPSKERINLSAISLTKNPMSQEEKITRPEIKKQDSLRSSTEEQDLLGYPVRPDIRSLGRDEGMQLGHEDDCCIVKRLVQYSNLWFIWSCWMNDHCIVRIVCRQGNEREDEHTPHQITRHDREDKCAAPDPSWNKKKY